MDRKGRITLDHRNKGDKRCITRHRLCEISKSLRPGLSCHVERMQNQRIPKEISAAAVKVRKKMEIPRKRWRDDVVKGLNVIGIKIQAVIGQRPSVIQEDCIGSQGPRRPVLLEKLLILLPELSA